LIYRNFVKRLLDCLASFLAIGLLFPLFLIISIGIYAANKNRNLFFTQIRPGKNAKMFKIIKFKTMTDAQDEKGKLLSDKDRMTKFGKVLRSTSLDELPQLLNVLKGDMSIVGPRPLLPKYLPLYNERQARRHEVKPGITGWTQVNGRNSISWNKKFEMDVWYAENLCFTLDMKILWMTILKVLNREGINAPDSVSGMTFTIHEN